MADAAQIIIFRVSKPCSIMMFRGNLMHPSLASLSFVHIDAEVNKGEYFLLQISSVFASNKNSRTEEGGGSKFLRNV
jgi:hypothetical protein